MAASPFARSHHRKWPGRLALRHANHPLAIPINACNPDIGVILSDMVCAPDSDRETILRIVDDILTSHHARTRDEIGRMEAQIGDLRRLSSEPRVVDLERELLVIATATREHFDLEERLVFPACLSLAHGRGLAGNGFADLAAVLVDGHDGSARDLPRLLFMVRAIPVPAAGVAIRDGLHDTLRSICYDLPLHRHKEERLLLPAARRLAAA